MHRRVALGTSAASSSFCCAGSLSEQPYRVLLRNVVVILGVEERNVVPLSRVDELA